MLFHPRRKRPARRALRRNINLLIISELFAELRFYFPVAVLVFQSITGSYAAAMSVFAFSSIMQAVLEVPTGILSDKWGRRGTLIAGTLGEVAAVGCYTLAYSSSTSPLWLLYTGSLCYGFANALFSGNNQAMIVETLGRYRKTKETAKILGRLSAFGQIGLGLGGACAGLMLWAGLQYDALLSLSLISLSITVLIAFFTVEPPDPFVKNDTSWQHLKKSYRAILKNKKLLLYALASVVQRGGGQANYYFTPSFIDSVWPTWATPFYRIGQHTIGAFSFWFSGTVIKRFSALIVLQVGSLASNILSVIALCLSNVCSPFLFMLTQIAYGSGTTAETTVQQENFTAAQRATMGSIISLFSAFMTGITSVLTGWISDLSTPAFAMGFMIVARALIVQSTYWRIYRKHR